MKKLFLSLIVAALFGMPFATARDATAVRVTLKQQAGKPVKVVKLPPQSVQFLGVESVMKPNPTSGWHVVNIPLEIEAYTKKKDSNGNPLPVHYVPSLSVKVHLLFKHQDEQDKEASGVLLSKELTYVDIPLPNKGKKNGVRENEMYAGVFISPADAWEINEKSKGELDGQLVAYAVEATFNGAKCMNTDVEKTPHDQILVKNMEREWNLTGKWWTRSTKPCGAELKTIAETPYAYAAGAFYPALAPVVASGVTAMGSETMPASTSSTPSDTTDTTTTADDSTGGEDAGDTETPADTKRTKGKRRSRRGSAL